MSHVRGHHYTSPIDTASWITLRWVRGTRYYRVHLEQDLWSAWLLTKVYGRRNSALGRTRAIPAPSIEVALLELAAIATRRRKRGYEFTN
jgi:hypothetical protein